MSIVTTYTGGRLAVTAGRVTEIDVGAGVAGIVSDPEGGNVTVNPDGTLALVLPDPEQRGNASFTVLVEDGGGTRELTVDLDLKSPKVESGWGAGDYYTLATDDDDRSVIEAGENHRKVYVTGSDDALSVADIAKREGLREAQIDAEWLAAHPEYGATEDMALDVEAGMKLWSVITGRFVEPASHHLLFERGYEYEGTDRLIESGTQGETALHPVLVGAWGEGAQPMIKDGWRLFQDKSENIVFQSLDFGGGGSILGAGEAVLIDDVLLRDASTVIQGAELVTMRNSQILDVSDAPKTNGLFVRGTEGLLIEGVLADHSGWEDGWETGDGRPPTAFSHNLYIQWDNLDVTLRDTVTMRGSSFGAQVRSGGVVENNAFLDNNIALNVKGGNYRDGDYSGNYSLVLDNVVSSGANKEGAGAESWGIRNLAPETSFIGNIIAHLADPADPAELAERTESTRSPLKHNFAPFIDDTIIYKWVPENLRDDHRFQSDSNVPDIAEALLDEVTLRRFIEAEIGRDPGDVIDTLATWLRANWSGLSASEVVDFFQNGFGISREIRTEPETLRFVPDARGDGMRWDNRLNWSTEDKPIDGDSVDLAGNWVTYSGTVDLAGLELGEGGLLTVRQGRLDTDALETGAGGKIAVGLAGQIWTDGFEGEEVLDVDVTGGRFANTGSFSGPVDLDVSGGEMLLATSGARFALDGRLAIDGSRAKVGFDGQGGGAVLALTAGAELAFAADADGLSGIREFRSGAWGTNAPDIASAIDLGRGDTLLSLDLGGMLVGSKGEIARLASADALTGGFGTIAVDGAKAGDVTVRIDYGTDRMELVTASSGGDTKLVLVGSAEKDVFVAAAGVEVTVEKYETDDSIDLSAALDFAALDDLVLSMDGRAAELLDDDGALLARIEGGEADRVWVRADGWEVRVDETGAGSARELPDAGPVSPPPNPGSEPDDPPAGPEDPPTEEPMDPPAEPEDPPTDEPEVPEDPPVEEPGEPEEPPAEEPEEPELAPNAAPEASSLRLQGDADGAFEGRVTATDADGDDLVFTLGSGPRNGSVSLAEDGSFAYDADGVYDELPLGETRTERFDFVVSDGRGGSDRGSVTLVLEGAYEPPAQGSDWNQISGTSGFDVIEGTDGADLIRTGGGGYDRVWGGEGADAFVFGAGARDGARTSDQIFDFNVEEDILVIEAGAEIARTEDRDGTLWLTLEGDEDVILVGGNEVSADALEILQADDIWLG